MFNWRTTGKDSKSLRSPWVSIFHPWLKVEAWAKFKLGNGREGDTSFNNWFSKFFRIASLPEVPIAEHWDLEFKSWS